MTESQFKVHVFVFIGRRKALCLNASTLAITFEKFISDIVRQIFGTEIKYYLFADEELTQRIENQNQEIDQKNIYLQISDDQYHKCMTKTFYVPKSTKSTPIKETTKQQNTFQNQSPISSQLNGLVINNQQKEMIQSPVKSAQQVKLLSQNAPKKVIQVEKQGCCLLI